MTRALVLGARRTAVAPDGGAFRDLRIEDLAAPVIGAVLADAGLAAGDVDELILANALGAGGNPARRAALLAGLPDRVAGLTLDRQCAGGLDAIALGVALVASGQARVVVAGGAESASMRPLRAMRDPGGGPPVPYEQAPFTPWPDRDPDMVAAADALAVARRVSRAAQDACAVESHAKARAAAAALAAEIVPLAGLDHDAFTRRLTPALAARMQALQPGGTVTAANMAVSADAAAFVVIADARLGRPGHRAAEVLAAATVGAAPDEPGLSAIGAVRAALARAGLDAEALAAAEVMEAFAVQALVTAGECALPQRCLNRRGGGLARGHPIGASGAILAVRLFHDLSPGHCGLAAIAAAGGIGSALILRGAD